MPTKEEVDKLKKEVDKLTSEKTFLVGVLNTYSDNKVKLEKDIASLEASRKLAVDNKANAESELKEVFGKIESAMVDLAGLYKNRLSEIERKEADISAVIAEANGVLEKAKGKYDEASIRLNSAKAMEEASKQKVVDAERLVVAAENQKRKVDVMEGANEESRKFLARERTVAKAKLADVERVLADTVPIKNEYTAKLKDLDMRELRLANLNKEMEELKDRHKNEEERLSAQKIRQDLNERMLTDKGRRLDLLEKKVAGREGDVETREDAVLLREKRVGNQVRKYKLKEELENV